MGKKKNRDGLGRSIMKDKFGGRKVKGDEDCGSMRHTSNLNDGFDWGRLNLQSVTEQSNLDDFLATAELAGTEFTAEKLNITFVNSQVGQGLLSAEEKCKVAKVQEEHRQFLKIPRRPAWDSNTSAEELQQKERESFLEWRRGLAELQEVEGILLTPFEKNLEFWRQLWRVIERSDVVVQIVDARNPLLFRCEDLEKYVKEHDENKMNIILVNKADLLTESQREAWAVYFDSIGMPVVFFSALNEYGTYDEDKETDDDENDADVNNVDRLSNSPREERDPETVPSDKEAGNGKSKLYTREKLIQYFKTVHTGKKVQDTVTTIGLVGYPNVGKSSTINAILTFKKVSVSATPGKTKHFQTLFVDSNLCLCDCPGLVMPTFVSTKAEMVVSGILPIDQMRDHVAPVNAVLSRIPRQVLESTYGIMIPKPLEGEDETRPPTAEEFLNSYGYMRGFMTQRGLPDNPRAARYILKDYVKGKLLFCHAPPTVKQEEYHKYETSDAKDFTLPGQLKSFQIHKLSITDLDNKFFGENRSGVHIKEVAGISKRIPPNTTANTSVYNSTSSLSSQGGKHWKKHHNSNKREKLRRKFSDLDQ